jgi:alanine dehydrogenase
MVIGVPREIKAQEYRVAVTPGGVSELLSDGHRVLIEKGAGLGSGFGDEEYEQAGATLCQREQVFGEAGLIVKVKEPLPEEYGFFGKGTALLTFLHLAAQPELTDLLVEKNITAFAYETLEERGGLPLLAPMSEIAGRMSALVGAFFLQKPRGGSGVLPAGATGVLPARAVILGAGVVGSNAARVAQGLGMRVTVLNRGIERLKELDWTFRGTIETLPATQFNISKQIREADILVGAVLVAGKRAPMLVSREMVSLMKAGSVIVDVAVDQGGCVETTRPTTHDEPVYDVSGILHYAVANMPGAYPRTSTLALTNSTLPYLRRLAALGPERAIREDGALRTALNTYRGGVAHRGLAQSTGRELLEIGA